ncbi:MAG: class I SAM-dependent methyltransferase [Proteobacteria bacterium]|nr:class I SAM-dependent methyltransferase [Pseudomonadota bacterium]
MARVVPERIRVAVESLDLRPDARVLEVGCGTGVAAKLLCRRVPEGHVTALDRSGTAVAHAERRLARWIEAGIADVVERDLAGFHGDGRPYDVVLAININVFWTGQAGDAVARLVDLLAHDGEAHLWFEAPPGGDAAAAGAGARSALVGGGLDAEVSAVGGLAHVVGRRRPGT